MVFSLVVLQSQGGARSERTLMFVSSAGLLLNWKVKHRENHAVKILFLFLPD